MSSVKSDNLDNPTINQLLEFISGYGSREPPQSIEEIQGDFQLAGLSTILNSILSHNPQSKILDIGCGNGVLMNKLVEIKAFKNYPELEYVGFDFEDKLPYAFENANNLKILPYVKFLSLESNWTKQLSAPCVVVIRNVFHELKINEVAKLIHEICMLIPAESVFLLQDMTTLPKAEKGRAGWFGIHLAKIFQLGGIETNHTPDTSKRGVDVFLIEGRRYTKCELSEKDILNHLIDARNEQLHILGLKYADMKEDPSNNFPILRLNHDIAAISLQLLDIGGKVEGLRRTNDGQTVASTFNLAFSNLSEIDIDKISKKFKYPAIKSFQNRSHSILALDEFIRSDKTIFILLGRGYFIGKKTVVWHALEKSKHRRLPLFVNLTMGTDIIHIIEELTVQLEINRYLDIEILASLGSLPTEEIKIILAKSIRQLANKTILILDGFENIIDPNGNIDNEDVNWLINLWSGIHGANVIIESRAKVEQLPFERCQIEWLSTFKSRPEGRFGKYLYTVQLLKELVPTDYRLPDGQFGGFPLDLLESLDNHPYLTNVAGIIIRNNSDIKCLSDNNFIANLKYKLYSSLLSNINLNDAEKEMIYSFTLIKDSFPLKFVDIATEDSMIRQKLLEMGVFTEISPGRFKPLEILKLLGRDFKEFDMNQIEKKWHSNFAKIFIRLYDETSDPAFFRQSHYHATLSGHKKDLIAYHIPEISLCADTWFKSKKYDDALWAYQNIEKIHKLHPKEQMRLASCYIRTKGFREGDALYRDLFRKHESWDNVKNSYVDSLLYIGGKEKKALNILAKIPAENREHYWHFQAARCYRRLNDKKKTYQEYEDAIINSPKNSVWQIIHEFVNYARTVGDTAKEEEWLNYTWNDLKIRSNAVKIDMGAFYERNEMLKEAEQLLSEVHRSEPSNAYCILPLIKTLCKLDEINEARVIIEDTPSNVNPYDVFVYSKIIFLKNQGRFSECVELLSTLPMLEKDRFSIHRWGQWADLFLSWSQNLHGKKQINKAKQGLKFVNEIIEERNVPALMACLELSKIVGDADLRKILGNVLHEVNDSYFWNDKFEDD